MEESEGSMKKVLILTYYWPPGSGPGVQRWLKMARFLPEFGIEPIILTVKDGAYPSRDESLLNQVPDDLHVIHTDTLEPFELFNTLRGKKGNEISVGLSGMKDSSSLVQRFGIWLRANFFIPDARIGWKKYALKAAVPLMQDIDAIISTGPPHSTHLIAMELKKRFHVPWLADFRDPWSTIHYHELMPMWDSSLRKHKSMENQVLKEADALTVVSEGMKREFSDRREDITVVYNGFDELDFKRNEMHKSSTFTLSYIGNLKPNQDVPLLWKTISELIQEFPEFANTFRLQLIGKKDAGIIAELESIIPEENLKNIDHLAHHDAVNAMCDSDALLFIIPRSENNKLILTGKLFEYLASGRPLLSIGPVGGDADQIIQDAAMEPMIDYEDNTSLKKTLLDLFQTHKTRARFSEPSNSVKKFSRRAQTEASAKSLNYMIQKRGSS